MKRVVSESLTLHAQSLIKCVEQYGWQSWLSHLRLMDDTLERDWDKLEVVGAEAARDVVAELVTDTIARYNARCDEPIPKTVPPQIPPLPTIDRQACRIWTMEELYDEHVRMLKPDVLITGALNWYLTRFWSELCSIGNDWDNNPQVIWYDRQQFHESLKGGSICPLYVITSPQQLNFVTEADTYSGLVEAVATNPMGFYKQGDAWILTDDMSGYLLDPDDLHSDDDHFIEYWVLTEEALRKTFK
ncbi:hypothetical protein ASESINO_227 [Erwinia phage vB_EamM_Asesino]|uniref:Uncharacterized protein n=1 Tax=Erwinia phage vB_EamM_Asesino TaxID=1883370 RepID=A0A1B2IAF8_9CAUD|nr:hypothetical protein ASESINO_227 [Erwinia phage vB_EamM_Asesino]ANZ48240.1 hypothetical protein ASESINO_227 [Erwinia phage vB_EamM_Asesino]